MIPVSAPFQVPGEQDFGDEDMEEVLVGPVALLDDVPMPLLGLSPNGEEPEAGEGRCVGQGRGMGGGLDSDHTKVADSLMAGNF